MNAYDVLGVSRGATLDQVREAYRRAAWEHHPDRRPVSSAERADAEWQMAAINAARESILRDHARRAGSRVPAVVPQQRRAQDPARGVAHHAYVATDDLLAAPQPAAAPRPSARNPRGSAAVSVLLAAAAAASMAAGLPIAITLLLLGALLAVAVLAFV